MSTINGVGTTRYDWSHLSDGTAEATLWFVIGFLPIVPLKRQRLQLLSTAPESPSAIGVGLSALGFSRGFSTEMAILEPAPLRLAGVLRTYFFGFVVAPFLAFGIPIFVGWGGWRILQLSGVNLREYGDYLGIAFGIAAVGWMGAVIAKILDRAAGRNAPSVR
jgi:hypothetical protein